MSDIFDLILHAIEERQPVAQATIVGPAVVAQSLLGRKLLLQSDGTIHGSLGAPSLDDRIIQECRRALAGPPAADSMFYGLTNDESQALQVEPGTEIDVFLEVMLPPETLLIVGAGHIARPLSRIGKMLGFEVAVIDDRISFANRERFPEADRVIAGYYNQELERFPITASTYIVLVTRGHTHDEEALRRVIGSTASYIGMIGSRRRVSAVLRHMVEEGIPREQVDRVFSPIGIDIGAETPEEIAVSILAEVINVRRRGSHHPSSMSHKDHSDARGGR